MSNPSGVGPVTPARGRQPVKLTDRESGEVFYGHKYVQGAHPPPPGVRVTTGKNGVLARADTLHGAHSVIYSTDWLVTTPAGIEIYTDKYVHDFFRLGGDPAGPVKPKVLG